MAIRFPCPSCIELIEVDDQWARRLVACPYCHGTIRAPGESIKDEVSQAPPVANPAYPAEPLPAHSAPKPYPHPEFNRAGNSVAVVAFVLASLGVGLVIIGIVIAAQQPNDSLALQQVLQEAEGTSGQLQAVQEYIRQHGGTIPTWLIAITLLQLCALVFCATALVCGIVALRRTARRKMSVAAATISGGYILLSCANVFW